MKKLILNTQNRPLRPKNIAVLCIGVFILLLLIFSVIRANSLTFALQREGLDATAFSYVKELDIDSGDNEFCVIQTTTKDGKNVALVMAEKNRAGFWVIEDCETSDTENGIHYALMAWVKSAGARRFTHLENAVFAREWNYLYCGCDAIKKISYEAEAYPRNAAVNIQQAGAFHLVHVITFTDPEELGFEILDVRVHLEEQGAVTPCVTKQLAQG